ncbi:alginate lyase family protein [Falsihalocynthiibacter sp. S25ZX9]|uniref:alginate lyase family protein n=1 Tax=Falsihalocynthiibacter sp. S25ZX9 TaxID=3240870 RepID=UPI00350F6A40
MLPWDGNCFLTKSAWSKITKEVMREPYLKYFVVPMARIVDNNDLLNPRYSPDAVEEPQMVFRNDAPEEFNEECSYGRRPKVELFWRLGIRGIWDNWGDDLWDLPRPVRATQVREFGKAGWVARMQSGRNDLEADLPSSIVARGQARVEAISLIIDQVDHEVLRRNVDPMALTAYNCDLIESLEVAPEDTEKGHLYTRLLQEADLALQRGPYSVTQKTTLPPSGDMHDYYHPSPYWWDASDSDTGLATYRDGLRAPGTRLYEPESDRYDRTRLQKLFDDTTLLALAGAACNQPDYSRHAAKLVRHWFINTETRMNPNLNFAQVKPIKGKREGVSSGLIEMKDLYFFLDAVRLLRRSGEFTEEDHQLFSAWLREYMTWLQESLQGIGEVRTRNNHGTYFDLQIGSIAAYLGDVEVLSTVFRRSRERISGQFDIQGAQEHELTRTQTQHYCAFNLQAWVHLATLADSCGDRLWDYVDSDGRGLAIAFTWILSKQSEGKWPYKQITPFDRDRFLPLIFAARAQYVRDGAVERALGYVRKPIFSPHDGIMPFWMLSRMVDASGGQANDELLKRISQSENTFRGLNSKNIANVDEIKVIEARLWGGYSSYAQEPLKKICQTEIVPKSRRADAAWALARWQSFCGDNVDSLKNVKLAQALTPSPRRRYVLAEVNLLTKLNRSEEGRQFAIDMLQHFPDDPNLFLQIANTYVADPNSGTMTNERNILSWFNRLYLLKGLTGIQKRTQNAPLDMFNIIGENDPTSLNTNTIDEKVSVILPVQNGAETLENALRSLQEQTWANLQIIVVDSASNDETRSIVKELAKTDPRIELLELSDNLGEYVARNAALEIAVGDYVSVHNANEWAHPQKIEYQLNYLRKSKGAIGVMSRWICLRADLFVVGNWRLEENFFSMNQSSFLIPRSVFAEIGPWDNVRVGAENEFIWRFRMRYGNDAIARTDQDLPVSVGLAAPDSLDRDSVTHARTDFHGLHKDYRRSYRRWQKSIPPDELALPKTDAPSRAFAAPSPILPIINSNRRYSRVFIADFSKRAHKIDMVADVVAKAASQSRKIGIFHWPDFETKSDNNFHDRIEELLGSFAIEQVSAQQKTTTNGLILCDPLLASYVIEGIPKFGAKKLEVLCEHAGAENVIFDGRQRRMPTSKELFKIFGIECEWVHFDGN